MDQKYILIAEDDKFLQKFTGAKLAKLGFKVETAGDGDETLLKMKNNKPDVVLLDLIMPKKDGFAVLEEARKDPEMANIPIIIFSSLDQAEDIERVKALGAKDFFDKTAGDFTPLKEKILELTQSKKMV